MAAPASDARGNPRLALDGSRLAYIIFTSGSTGVPKGAMLTHAGMLNHLYAKIDALSLSASDITAETASQCFDISIWQFLAPLLSGGCVIILPDAIAHDPAALLASLEDSAITIAEVVPSLARFLIEQAESLGGNRPALPSLRWLLLTGEAMPPEIGRAWLRIYPSIPLVNAYGPTECSDDVTHHFIHEEAQLTSGTVPVGKPLANTRLYILDAGFQPVPIGVAGELFVGGAGVGRGYLGDARKTAGAFVPDPYFSSGGRMYRTGDLARFLTGGEIEFLGRSDHQVKIRGYRIELGEVDDALARHPDVRAASTVAAKDRLGGYRMVAYLVMADRGNFSRPALEAFLKDLIPAYMLPQAYVLLDAFPLTANGKIDRKALPDPDAALAEAQIQYLAPRTPAEELVAQAWVEVLGLKKVGVLHDFFDLGGHSLLATQILSRLKQSFGIEIPLRDIFEFPTVAQTAQRIETILRDKVGRSLPIIPRADKSAALPLSFAQQRLWLLDRLEGTAAYNIFAAVSIEGDFSVDLFASILGEIADRHEILRTSFHERSGEVEQSIHARASIPVSVTGLDEADPESQRAEIARLAAQEAGQAFDLERAPLARVKVVECGGSRHIVMFTVHHIVCDGWSIAIFIGEAARLYAARREGRSAEPAALPLQYADFAAWQREWLLGGRMAEQISYWKTALAGSPPLLELPWDFPRPATQSFRGARVRFRLDPGLAEKLGILARKHHATLFMTLLSGFAALLSRYSGQPDICIGTPVANRSRQELEPLIGLFVNTLVLRLDLSGDPAFGALISESRKRVLEAHANQDVPFEKLVEEMRPKRDLSYGPLFQVMFAMQNRSLQRHEFPGLSIVPVEAESASAKFDLTLVVNETDESLDCEFEYSTDLFAAGTISRMAANFERLLRSACANPEVSAGALDFLDSSERETLLAWNPGRLDPAPDAGPSTYARILAQAKLAPASVAAQMGEARMTYAQLVSSSQRIASRLRMLGAGPGTLVAIHSDRRLELLSAMLGIWETGAAYLPLDPGFPPDRLAYVLADSGAKALLWDGPENPFPEVPGMSLRSALAENEADRSGDPEGPGPGREDLAYVLYTSGSTGKPKGVQVRHVALANYLRHMDSCGYLSPGGKMLAATTISFDISATELFLPLVLGGTVVMAGSSEMRDGRALNSLIETCGVSALQSTPVTYRMLLEAGWKPDGRQNMIVGGESIPPDLAQTLSRSPGKLFLFYGPTEATIWSTMYLVDPGNVRTWLGRPIPGITHYVLDRRGLLVPMGVAGELCIGGVCLARGYLGRPALTADRFRPDAFGRPGERVYRTGDLVRQLPSGDFEFLGRIDNQIKLRGYRIELGEIEAALGRLPGVKEYAAAVRGGSEGRLVAYLVAYPDQSVPDEAGMRASLGGELPEYMVPSAVVALTDMPRTPNGKIDRAALPEPGAAVARAYVAPRTPVEEGLVAIIRELLGIARLGITDNFFELGGHSLLVLKAISRIRDWFAVELEFRDLFESADIATLARIVESKAAAGAAPVLPAPERSGATGPFPLSHAQTDIWRLEKAWGPSPTFNMPYALRLSGNLDVGALEAAFADFLARHDALRSRFHEAGGVPMQTTGAPEGFSLEVRDFTALAADAAEAETSALVSENSLRPFNLGSGPLLRPILAALPGNVHVLSMVIHHIAFDGWSEDLLVRELLGLYESRRSGATANLPELPIAFSDYVRWEREWLDRDAEAHLEYFRTALSGARPVFPDESRSYRARALNFTLEPDEMARLSRAGSAAGATLFSTLLAAFASSLTALTGSRDLIINSPIASRYHKSLEGMVGFFVGHLLVRLRPDPGSGTHETVRDTARACRDAFAHSRVPLAFLAERLKSEEVLEADAVGRIMFNLIPDGNEKVDLPGISASPERIGASEGAAGDPPLFSPHDLSLSVRQQGDAGMGCLVYHTDSRSGEEAERLVEAFREAVRHIGAGEDLAMAPFFERLRAEVPA